MFLVKHKRNRDNDLDFYRSFDNLFTSFWDDSNWLYDYDQDSTVWTPRTDIEETENEYIVKSEVPGLKNKDISITLDNGVLTIKGERKREEKKKGHHKSYMERSYGAFCRSFTLPNGVDETKIAALLKDGILSVTLPKTEERKPKEIAIH